MSECEKYQDMISAMLDGELSPEEADELRAHMAECEECREMYDAFSALENALADDLVEAPAELAPGIMFRINNSVPPKKRSPRAWRYAAAAACVVIVAAAAVSSGLFSGAKAAAPEAAEAIAASGFMDNSRISGENANEAEAEMPAPMPEEAESIAFSYAAADNAAIDDGICADEEAECDAVPAETAERASKSQEAASPLLLFEGRSFRYTDHTGRLPDGAITADASTLCAEDGIPLLEDSSETGLFFRKDDTLFVPDGSGAWNIYVLD